MRVRTPWIRSPWVARTAAAEVAAGGFAPYLTGVSQADIFLTESAAKRVASIAARQSKPAILRLAVDGGGCAGFTYKFELADAAEADDTVAETAGVTLVVDPISLDLVRGSAVDFVE